MDGEFATDGTLGESANDVQSRVSATVIGRGRELELALAAVSAGRDLVMEGPPGTSKTTILKAITAEWGIHLVFVEGNGDLTPAKLIGHHNPARVLREDYSAGNFVRGPLVEAMESGGFLYIEELNRAPEDTLNTLLTAMADRAIMVPRVGLVSAKPSFRVIASMNPYDNVGTTRLSSSITDRFNRIVVDYQDTSDEERIVLLRTELEDVRAPGIAADAVAVTRATRSRVDIRQGSSVRGAIDCALILDQLLSVRAVAASATRGHTDYNAAALDAMLVSLSGRIHVDESSELTAEEILREIWEDHFVLEPAEQSGPT